MTRWLIASLPLVGGVLVAVLFDFVPGEANTRYQLFSLVGKGLAAVGALVAAAQFDRGDYLRRAWGLVGLCYVLLFANTLVLSLVLGSRGEHQVPALETVRGVSTVVANVASIIGMVLVGRAWRVAGLDLQVGRGVVVASTVLTFALGLAIAGPGAWEELSAVLHGKLGSLAQLASAVGDVVSLTMLAPMVLTALALRGGSLAWPWAMNALSALVWLIFDSASVLEDLHVEIFTGLAVLAALRVSACLFQLSGGLLQRLAVKVG